MGVAEENKRLLYEVIGRVGSENDHHHRVNYLKVILIRQIVLGNDVRIHLRVGSSTR